MSRLLSPIWRRMRLLVSRGVLKMVADEQTLQSVQVTLLGESPAWAERFQQYGITSVPHGGAEAVVASVGGARAHLVALVVDDRRYRMSGLKGGEVAIYDDLGQSVHLTREGIVIKGAGLPLAFVDCPVVTMDGDLEVAGNVRDHTSTMQGIRDIYNDHHHGGPGPTPGMN
ncbi:phage baseplate assembly protein V [Ectopseudomonas hydrolytica]|uniref:Phage baseplate assembly protein V n=1 Tax=Ectopseudomonas hydrolytica TaxID=2493633 RepID=A0ABY5AAN8_9GAMM|nr:phage baseplate assembly protein V [Pseudomonas hydrolytica]USR40782.1 phage baseplate assembly protein V [Pseudomonas hydrolytica]